MCRLFRLFFLIPILKSQLKKKMILPARHKITRSWVHLKKSRQRPLCSPQTIWTSLECCAVLRTDQYWHWCRWSLWDLKAIHWCSCSCLQFALFAVSFNFFFNFIPTNAYRKISKPLKRAWAKNSATKTSRYITS